MNEDLKKKLILLLAIFVAIVLLYYIMSPYQHCMRMMDAREASFGERFACFRETGW
jgi:hypothetical protein